MSLFHFFFPHLLMRMDAGCRPTADRCQIGLASTPNVIRHIDNIVGGSHLWSNHTTESCAYSHSYTKLPLRITFSESGSQDCIDDHIERYLFFEGTAVRRSHAFSPGTNE